MTKRHLITAVLLTVGFAWAFLTGVLTAWFIISHTDLFPKKDPPSIVTDHTREEYDLLFVSKDLPHKLLFIDYYTNGKVVYGNTHYYNGTSWKQGAVANDTVSALPTESVNRSVYKLMGSVNIDGTVIDFSAPEIYTHMVIRARETFGKFGGATETPSAKLAVDGDSFDCYAALLVGFNSTEDLADWKSLGVKTDWLMFFDKDWNFNHLDNTVVDRFSPLYESHSFLAGLVDSTRVTYFPDFAVSGSRDSLAVNTNGSERFNIKITDTFDRRGYDGVSWGGLATNKDGGAGVYLSIDTHQ